MRITTAPYTESRLAHLVRNKCVGFPVVEQYMFSHSSIIFFSSSARPDAEFGLADEAVKGTVAAPGRE